MSDDIEDRVGLTIDEIRELELTDEEREIREQAIERVGELDATIEQLVPGADRVVEVRSAASLEVRFDERVIDVVAVPYGEHAIIEYRGRAVDETIERGAFEGIQMRARDFPKVNRAHDRERPIGWVRRFKPRDERGLVAELSISRTREGDDSLELAADGLLGASVGFAVLPGGERWTLDRRSRTVTKAWLDHLALTGDPAYKSAKVIAVRSADPIVPLPDGRLPTPNLDEVLAWMRSPEYRRTQP
jgi:HK97 family phage prohead protease